MSAVIHKPIATTYGGTTFRSILEARYAVFFDEIGLYWMYEPFVFNFNNISYTPDFVVWGIESNVGSGPRISKSEFSIIEIKPCPPNNEYLAYLRKVRDPDKSEILVMVGNPDFYQPNGYIIGRIGRGFRVEQCPLCRTYVACDMEAFSYLEANKYGLEAFGHHHPFLNLKSPDVAKEYSLNYRFDL